MCLIGVEMISTTDFSAQIFFSGCMGMHHAPTKILSCRFISSIEFDRDDEFFATAGVSRRVKVFNFETVCSLYHGGFIFALF